MEIIQHNFLDGKACRKCGAWQQINNFDKNPTTRDRRVGTCKSCLRAYRAGRVEIAREQTRQWRKVNGKYSAAQRNEWDKKWREKNRERVRENVRRYHKQHPEVSAATSRRYNARKAGASGSYTTAEWNNLCARHGFRCLRCDAQAKLTVDHIVPLSKGGKNTIDNLQPLCGPCNSWKRDRAIDYRAYSV